VLRYEVEKSTDGQRFVGLATVPAVNATGLHRYGATDGLAVGGWVYYRLKVVDNQQHRYYTPAIKVWVGPKVAATVQVLPNPAQDFLKIILPESSNCEVAIVNSSGQVVKRVSATQAPFTIDIKSLNQGMYFVYIQTNRQAIVQRFVKQ
jgi:hypothetical protein